LPFDPAAGVWANMPRDDAQRLFKWRRGGNGLLHIKSPNRTLAYELRPSTRLSEAISTNSSGFRDREFSMHKPEEAYRIIVVGDSVTFGWLERLENTYPKMLQRMLKARCGNGHTFEVYNMGIGGYNAAQELELMKTKAMQFHPDLVIVQYAINDNEVGADAGLWRHFSRGRLRTLDFIRLRWERLKERMESESLVKRSYREIAQVSRDTGVPVFVVLFPPVRGVDVEPLVEVRGFVRRLGLPHLDLTDAFTEFGRDMLLYDDIIHPNTIGHWIAAQEILRQLMVDFKDPLADWCIAAGPETYLARERFRNGLKHQLAGRIRDATAEYRKAYSQDAEYGILASTAITRWASTALWEQDNPAVAAELCTAAIGFDPQNGAVHMLLGLALEASGQAERALEAYGQAIALGTESDETFTHLGDLLAAKGRLGEAAQACDAAVAIDDNFADSVTHVLEALAAKFLEDEKWDEAIEALRLAVKFSPHEAWVLSNMAMAWAHKGDLQVAIDLWREAIAVDPEFWHPYDSLDKAFIERNDPETRIAEWRRAVQEYPQAVRPLFHLGMALQHGGHTDEAIETFRKAMARDPHNDGIRGQLGCVLAWEGDFDAALQVCREPSAIEPAFAGMVADALEDGANALMDQNRAKEASEGYRGAIALAPASAAKRYPLLIEALCEAGHWEAAWREVAICRETGVELPGELLEKLEDESARANR